MNENLNAIEYEIRNFGCNTIQHSLDVIHRCAERMAAEIERLKTPPCIVADNICPIDTMNCKISALKCEISRLKAELEKMKKCDACDDCWRSKGNPPYCSRGQRRESEEGK